MALQRQLIPPFRYAIVEESLFRGAYPTIKNFRFLRRLHLKTLVSLTPEAHPNRDMREFCEHERITVHNIFVDKFHDGVTLSCAKVIQVLQIVIRPENLPVYVHCLDGTHVTGVVVMCLRKLQRWNLSTSTAEFCQFEKDGEISREESQFVESFRGEIAVPPVIPKWLWQGIRTVSHPSFRLRLLPDADAAPTDAALSNSALTTDNPGPNPNPNPGSGNGVDGSSEASLVPASGAMDGTVINGDGEENGRRQSGGSIHVGVWVGDGASGVDEAVNKRGGVLVKAPILPLDRTARATGPQAIVGFARKESRDGQDSAGRRDSEGVDLLGSERVPERSCTSNSSKSNSSREQEVPQFLSTRR